MPNVSDKIGDGFIIGLPHAGPSPFWAKAIQRISAFQLRGDHVVSALLVPFSWLLPHSRYSRQNQGALNDPNVKQVTRWLPQIPLESTWEDIHSIGGSLWDLTPPCQNMPKQVHDHPFCFRRHLEPGPFGALSAHCCTLNHGSCPVTNYWLARVLMHWSNYLSIFLSSINSFEVQKVFAAMIYSIPQKYA